MSSDQVNKWLSLIANTGVLAGLFLVAYELNQSTKLAETEAATSRLDQRQTAHTIFSNSEYLPAIKILARDEGVDALSAVERDRLRYWEQGVVIRMESHYLLYTQGYLDASTANKTVSDAASSLTYWRALEIKFENKDFEAAVIEAAAQQALER